MKILSKRNKQRFLRHHLVLAFICGASLLTLYSLVQSDDVKFRWSLTTGYVGLALLGATLITGALNVLRSRRNPVSTDLRRDIGIWCGTISLAHVVIGLQIHLGGKMLLYFFRETSDKTDFVPRADLFGFANYAGLIAALVITLLLALSNDISLRRLGSNRWKFLQRWNYAIVVFVMLHSFAYQFIEKRQLPYLLLFSLVVGTTLTIQLLGFWRKRREAAKV
jgi:methionine sulfoxide reductase heme-binding subunit